MIRTFYLFYLGAAFIKCAPTDYHVTFYQAIVENCPTLVQSPDFKDLPLVHKCSDLDKLSKIQELTNETRDDVLCLLYYTSITQYCSQSKQMNTTQSTVPNVNISTICDNLDIIPKQVGPDAALRKIIATKEDCRRLCSIEFDFPRPTCSKSYYYSHPPVEAEKNTNHMIPVPQEPTNIKQEIKSNPPATEPEIKPKVDTPKENPPNSNVNLKKTEHIENSPSDIAKNKPAPPQVQQNVSSQLQQKDPIQAQSKNANTLQVTGESSDAHKPVVAVGKVSPVADGASEPHNNEGKAKPVTQEKNVQKLVVTSLSPKNEETINVDGDLNTQLDKNPEVVNEDLLPSDDVNNNQLNNDRLESEEDLEEPSNPVNQKSVKPMQIEESEAVNFNTEMNGDSYFFTYFMVLCIIFIVGYVCYHNKQKILALILEGRRGKRQYRGRRPNSANYHKLDSNLEEAITSSCNKNTNNVIY